MRMIPRLGATVRAHKTGLLTKGEAVDKITTRLEEILDDTNSIELQDAINSFASGGTWEEVAKVLTTLLLHDLT